MEKDLQGSTIEEILGKIDPNYRDLAELCYLKGKVDGVTLAREALEK